MTIRSAPTAHTTHNTHGTEKADSLDGLEYAELTVMDDGEGIENLARSKVFDPFYTTRLEDGGSGLGLSVVHGVVGDHGGKVEFEQLAWEGTRLRIRLSLAKTPALG